MWRASICSTKLAISCSNHILLSIRDTSVWHVCGLLRCITEQPVITEIARCIQARWARFGVEVVHCTLYYEADARLGSLFSPAGTQVGNLYPLPGTQDGSSSPPCVAVSDWFEFRPPVHEGKVTVPVGIRHSIICTTVENVQMHTETRFWKARWYSLCTTICTYDETLIVKVISSFYCIFSIKWAIKARILQIMLVQGLEAAHREWGGSNNAFVTAVN